ncbi:MAG: hypothetical protein NVS3B26_08660 [Mycobacteriales bacterium]
MKLTGSRYSGTLRTSPTRRYVVLQHARLILVVLVSASTSRSATTNIVSDRANETVNIGSAESVRTAAVPVDRAATAAAGLGHDAAAAPMRRPGWDTRVLGRLGAGGLARRRSRRVLAAAGLFLTAGLLSAVALLSLAAPAQSGPERHLLGGWLRVWRGLAAGVHLRHGRAAHTSIVIAASILAICWLAVAVAIAVRPVRLRTAAIWSTLWAAPFLVSVPVMSRDAYAYLAQGEITRLGLDPYRSPVAALGRHSALLSAVDPLWRHTTPPYGPLSLRLSELAAVAAHLFGSPVAGLIALRVLAGTGVVLTAAFVCALARPGRRALALWLTISPLTLIQLISAAHHEAIVCAMLAGSVYAWTRQRPALAAAAAGAAGGMKITATVLLAAFVLTSFAVPSGASARLRAAARPALTGLAALAAVLVAAGWGDPMGWLRGLRVPGSVWDPLTPTSALTMAGLHLTGLAGTAHPHLAGVRAVSVLLVTAGGVVAAYLTCRGSARRDVALTAAYLAAIAALCGPVLWPWYLAPVAVLLACSRSARGWLACLLCGAAPALAVLPIGVVHMQRVAWAASLLALGILLVGSAALRHPRRPDTIALLELGR